MNPHEIIIKPLDTEKTNIQKEKNNQVSFEVARHANRIEIQKAIEKIFNVKVLSVNTMQIKGKTKQRGRVTGKRRNWKKALVRLVPGNRIEFFEGV